MIYAARSELSALMTRAGIGRGLAPGIADELTAAGVALCEQGMNGAQLVLEALGSEPKAARYSGSTLTGDCLPLLAPSAFDLAEIEPIKISTSAQTALLEGYALMRGGTWQITETQSQCELRKTSGAEPGRPRNPPPFAVSDDVWEGLKFLGLGALVPATAETAAGAGAGQIDND